MKPRKINRGRSHRRATSFRRRGQGWKTVGTIVLFALIVAAGVGVGMLLLDPSNPPPVPPSGDPTTTTTAVTTTVTDNKQPPEEDSTPTLSSVKAFYLPTAALADTDTLKETVRRAKTAGFNGVVFDLKDRDGKVYFAATGDLVAAAHSVTDTALSAEQLTAVIDLCRAEHVLPIPRLYAFLDKTASHHLPQARIHYKTATGGEWLDWYYNRGGKPWLNPYEPQAHEYLIGLGTQLKEIGFTALIYDGVQFPAQLTDAHFGNSAYIGKSKLEMLQTFVNDLTDALDGCEVSVAAAGLSTLGENTAVYGGNPLSFGANYLSPMLFPSALGNSLEFGDETLTNLTADPAKTVKTAWALLSDRMKLLSGTPPAILPWLEASTYAPAQIKAQIAALSDTPFVLYEASGNYPFESLK